MKNKKTKFKTVDAGLLTLDELSTLSALAICNIGKNKMMHNSKAFFKEFTSIMNDGTLNISVEFQEHFNKIKNEKQLIADMLLWFIEADNKMKNELKEQGMDFHLMVIEKMDEEEITSLN